MKELNYNLESIIDEDVELSLIRCKNLQMQLIKHISDSGWHDMIYNSKCSMAAVLRDETRRVPQDICRIVQDLCDVETTIQVLNRMRRKSRSAVIVTESGELSSGPISHDVVTENVIDVVGATMDTVSAGTTIYPSIGQQTNLELDDFFKRPVELYSGTIAIGSTSNIVLKVWDLWSLVPSVRAKLKNYAYFRGNLHVRVVISGSPFHSGCYLGAYQPYPTMNTTLVKLLNSTLSFTGMNALLWNFLSQSQGSFFIDVKSNSPAEIKVPFISPKPSWRLFNTASTAISDVTSFADFATSGSLYLVPVVPAASASTSPSSLSVQVFAYATDVELGCPTGTQIAITTESGADERETGPVERFASGAKQIASALSVVPAIAPYSVPSAMFLQGLEEVAAAMGWSRPTLVDMPILNKACPFQNGANTIGSETVQKITLDPKQEMSVDPRIGGHVQDEMNIQYLANIESYLTQFSWAHGTSPMSKIWLSRVSPNLETSDAGAAETYFQPTAMSFAAMPFLNWRGTIKFRFRIVCSAFHRGKIAIGFDPNIAQYSLITTTLTTNKQFLRIVDIQETQDFEVCVHWANPRLWAKQIAKGTTGARESQFGTSISTANPLSANGFIFVCPFTALQSPDNSDVKVIVTVSSPNLEVNHLTFTNMPTYRHIRTQSGISADEALSCLDLNKPVSDEGVASLLHFGERPVSFRALMKRYVTTQSPTFIAGSTTGNLYITGPIFPTNTLAYNGTATYYDLFSYLRYAYLGSRGGIRKRIRLSPIGTIHSNTWVTATLGSEATPSTTTTIGVDSNPPTCFLSGTVQFVPNTNGGIEIELPYYSRNLFTFTCADDLLGDRTEDEYTLTWVCNYLVTVDYSGSYLAGSFSELNATAEDFTFVRFIGAPYYTNA